MSITARRLTGALGAEVSGVDICSPLSAGEVDAVVGRVRDLARSRLRKHLALAFDADPRSAAIAALVRIVRRPASNTAIGSEIASNVRSHSIFARCTRS